MCNLFQAGVSNTQAYEGCIHEVRSKSVLLMFDPQFHNSYVGEVYDVEFKFSRGQFKKQHQAIDEVIKHFGPQVLFPKEIQAQPPQVNFVEENENPILNYKYYPPKNRVFKHKIRKAKKPISLPKQELKPDLDIVIEKIEILSPESPINLKSKKSPKKRKSVIETLFKDKMISEHGSEWIAPKLPLDMKLLDIGNKKLENEFMINDATVKSNGYVCNIIFLYFKNYIIGNYYYSENNKYRNGNNKNYNNRKKLPAYISSKSIPQVNQSGKLILKWINRNLNPEQKNAVSRILTGQARPLPYIIYGPPGTGKTVTVVEAVIQIFLLRSDSRILVVTPSNSAADLIVERIHFSKQIQIGDLARLNAFQRAPEAIPEVVRSYSFTNDELQVLSKVVRHRIVIATCTTSGGIYKLGLSEGHFTHCFIDEAGETTEPESMIPIGTISRHIQLSSERVKHNL